MNDMVRGEYMKRRYRNDDPDVCANDYGPPERNNGATWDDFHDWEVNNKLEVDIEHRINQEQRAEMNKRLQIVPW